MTGVTGLVGNRLAPTLAASHDVIGVCRRPPSTSTFTSLSIDLAHEWPARLLPSRIDAVVHLAQADNWNVPGAALDVFAVNLASAARLLEYAAGAGARHFVLMSTGGLYGSADHPLTEASPVRLADGALRYYFETKRSAEAFAALYGDRMTVSILRPFFIYGSGQRVPKLVPRLIESVTLGRAVRIRGDAGAVLNPVHVDDVVKVIEACIAQNHDGVINVAGGQVTSIRDMTLRIAALCGRTANFETEAGSPERFIADTSLMRRVTGVDPIGFDEGIASVLEGAHRL